MKLTITTQGPQVSWNFGTCSSIWAYDDVAQTHTEICCLDPGEHTLVCKAYNGGGWDGGFIEINGKRYCDDFRAGYNVTKKITFGGTLIQLIRLF